MVSEEEAYWQSVVRKLDSKDSSERGWASHVLATEFPKEEKSNLALAMKYCDPRRLKERIAFLAEHDTDEYCGSNCLHILKMLSKENA